MARTLVLLTAMVVGAVVAFVVISSMRRAPDGPESVVVRSFDALRDGDFTALEACYTLEAWDVVAPSLPAANDAAALGRFRLFMDTFQAVRIEAAAYRGERAEVEAIVEHAGGRDREVFQLVHAGGSWLID